MIDPDTTMVVTVGLPRSGKSTWARKMAKAHLSPIVNPDSIRLAIHGQDFYPDAEPLVWAHAQVMVRSLFNAGHKGVIVDATNLNENSRGTWRKMHPNIIWMVFTTDLLTCLKRTEVEGGNPELKDVIMMMHKSIEPFRPGDKLIFLDSDGNRLKEEPSGWRMSPDYNPEVVT